MEGQLISEATLYNSFYNWLRIPGIDQSEICISLLHVIWNRVFRTPIALLGNLVREHKTFTWKYSFEHSYILPDKTFGTHFTWQNSFEHSYILPDMFRTLLDFTCQISLTWLA